ncbi:MAG: nickel transporter permease [Bilifractor sp.]
MSEAVDNNRKQRTDTPSENPIMEEEALMRKPSEQHRIPSVRAPKTRHHNVRNRLILFGALVILLLVLSVFSGYLTPYDPDAQNLTIAKMAPSAAHLMGTDRYGRDMLSRVIAGSRASIFSALLLVGISTFIGTAAGVFCGWTGGIWDTVLMRISDIFVAFPGLVFALAIAGVLGGGIQNAILALAAVNWPRFARIARSQTLSQKTRPYIEAARLSGSSTCKLITKHILPNIIGPILVTAALDIGTMIMELAGLSFLGLGAKPPTAEWGSMMSDARSMITTAPWIVFSPGIAIFISVMIFNLFGDTLRDWTDPRRRGSSEA